MTKKQRQEEHYKKMWNTPIPTKNIPIVLAIIIFGIIPLAFLLLFTPMLELLLALVGFSFMLTSSNGQN